MYKLLHHLVTLTYVFMVTQCPLVLSVITPSLDAEVYFWLPHALSN